MFILVILLFVKAQAQTYSIDNWYQGKSSATVLTYDDWSPGQPAISLPQLYERDLVGSFYVTINNAWRETDFPDMLTAVSKGIEIGNHTKSHPDLTKLTDLKLDAEINTVKRVLDSLVNTQKVTTLAYPLGAYNQIVIDKVKEQHIAARNVSLQFKGGWFYDFAITNNDYFEIPTVEVNSATAPSDFADYIKAGINDGGLVTFMFHSMYNDNISDQWFDAITDTLHGELLDSVVVYKSKTWVTTLSNAVKYHKEKNSPTLTVLLNTADLLKLNLTDTLSVDSIYNHPLSITLEIPQNQEFLSLKQGEKTLSFSYSEDKRKVYFEAVPDNGDIVFVKNPNTGIDDNFLNYSISFYPNPSNYDFQLQSNTYLNLEILITNSLGEVVYSGNSAENSLFKIPFINQVAGVYFAQIKLANGTSCVKKIVKQ